MTWGAVAGAGISAAGSLLGGSDAPKMPKFRPWGATTDLGTTTFDRKGKNFSMTMSPTMQGFADQFTGLADQYFGGNSPTNPYQQFALGHVQGMLPGLFGGAMDASAIDPYAYTRFDQQMGGLGASAMQGGNAAAQAAQAAMAGYGPASAQSNLAFGLGMGMLGERPQSYDQLAAQRLGILREQAAPFEQRAFNSLQQNLFDTGRSGTTGGALQAEAFARGLGQADTARQLDAQGFAEQLYGRDLTAALSRNQMGAGLMGMGMEGLLSGANYGINALSAANQGWGTAGTLFGNQFGGATQFNELTNARAQQRLQNAQGIFGFGNELSQQDLQTGQAAITNWLGLQNALQGQAQFGASMGQAAMGSGQPIQGSQSPWGAALQGLGGAVAGMDLQGVFGGSKYDPNAARMAPTYTHIPAWQTPITLPQQDFSNIQMPKLNI